MKAIVSIYKEIGRGAKGFMASKTLGFFKF